MKHPGIKISFSLLLLVFTPHVFGEAPSGLRAGAAKVDISPDVFPIQLRSGRSSYVHDPLFVRAVALENAKGRVVIALVDAIGVGREMADEAKAVAARKTGWKPEEMLVSGTHTHSAPKGATARLTGSLTNESDVKGWQTRWLRRLSRCNRPESDLRRTPSRAKFITGGGI